MKCFFFGFFVKGIFEYWSEDDVECWVFGFDECNVDGEFIVLFDEFFGFI